MKQIYKDITTVEEGVIIHQVNCMGVMGSGVAKTIREKFQEVNKEYVNLCEEYHMRGDQKSLLGKLQTVEINDKLSVINSFTQYRYGRYMKHTNENMLIKNIITVCEDYPDREVYIPYLIGCGTGGGNWGKVFAGIRDLDNLTICKLPK